MSVSKATLGSFPGRQTYFWLVIETLVSGTVSLYLLCCQVISPVSPLIGSPLPRFVLVGDLFPLSPRTSSPLIPSPPLHRPLSLSKYTYNHNLPLITRFIWVPYCPLQPSTPPSLVHKTCRKPFTRTRPRVPSHTDTYYRTRTPDLTMSKMSFSLLSSLTTPSN